MRSVKFSVVARKNPLRPEDPAKYYGQAKASGEVTLNEMSEGISQSCTVTKPDILAVLSGLEFTIIQSLQNGEIVRLGELGSFRLTLRSEGTETEKEFTSARIIRPKLRFTPGKALKNALKTLNYSQAHSCKTQEEG